MNSKEELLITPLRVKSVQQTRRCKFVETFRISKCRDESVNHEILKAGENYFLACILSRLPDPVCSGSIRRNRLEQRNTWFCGTDFDCQLLFCAEFLLR